MFCLIRLTYFWPHIVWRKCVRNRLPDHRFFFRVVVLVTADTFADPGLGNTLRIAYRHYLMFEGEIPRRCGAGVEMLMEPHIRRDDHRPQFPVVSLRLAALPAHQAVNLNPQDDELRNR